VVEFEVFSVAILLFMEETLKLHRSGASLHTYVSMDTGKLLHFSSTLLVSVGRIMGIGMLLLWSVSCTDRPSI